MKHRTAESPTGRSLKEVMTIPPHYGPRSHIARAASMGLIYGGKLQDHLNQLAACRADYALIERRIMAHLR